MFRFRGIRVIAVALAVLVLTTRAPCCGDDPVALGEKALEKGDYKTAISHFDVAIRTNANNALAYLNRAKAYFGIQMNKQAVKDLDDAIRLDPKFARAFNFRGMIHRNEQRFELAFKDFEKAISLDPNFMWTYFNRGELFRGMAEIAADEDGRAFSLDQAIRDHSEVIRCEPKLDLGYLYRGKCYVKKQDHDAAIKDFTEAIRLKPTNAEAYIDRGHIHVAKKNFDLAIADYGQAIKHTPKSMEGLYYRARAHHAKKDYQSALADCTEVIRLEDGNVLAYHLLSHLLATCPQDNIRNGERATEYAKKACELTEWKAPFYFTTLAAAHAERGQFDEAVKWQKKAVEATDFPKDYLPHARECLRLYEKRQPLRED